MISPTTRRSPRQSNAARRSLLGLPPGSPTRPANAPLQPSPLRNEIASASKPGRKRARSLGGTGDDPTAPSSVKQINPRKKRMTIAPARGILKRGGGDDAFGGHTVIGVIQEALREEKAREEETESDIARRREMRKSLNRRVSFASHATIRLFPQAGQTPSPKKGVGFAVDGTPNSDDESTGQLSPQVIPPTPSPEMPRVNPEKDIDVLESDSEDTSMDIADDNLTLPLPSALVKRQLQRGVGFTVDDGDDDFQSEDEMDITQPFGGIIPPRDGVNRFLSGDDDDQTMEFTRVYPANNNFKQESQEDDTVGMEFTRVIGKIQGVPLPAADKENLPPAQDDNDSNFLMNDELTEVTMDMTRAVGSILDSAKSTDGDDTQAMDMTMAFGTIRTPQRHTATPESSPFYNSPIHRATGNTVANDADITRSPLSTGITGTPKRTPSRGLLALDLLTGKPMTPQQAFKPMTPQPAFGNTTPLNRRKSDSGILLGSPRAADRMRTRKSIAGVEEFNATADKRRVSIGREAWTAKEFGGDIHRESEEAGIRDMIAKMTPKKPTRSPVKMETPRRMASMGDDLMLTPGMMKREFGPKVANLVKVWEDKENNGDDMDEEEDFPPITLAEFLSMTNISFLDGLGASTRRRTFAPPEGLSSLQKPQFADYAKAGAVSIPMLELYQFSCQNASKYISEGKAMIEGIEQDTLEDPPLLFREYVGAPPELKRIMDSQFKLLKSWARFKAKGGWYSWRDQLLGGVMPTLIKNAEGLRKDKVRLVEMRGQLEGVFPAVKEQYDTVKKQLETLKSQRQEIESADQEELRRVREEISIVGEGLEMRRVEMQERSREAGELASEEAELRKMIDECRGKIDRAERVKELHRGFEKNEVDGFKETLECLHNISGWKVVKVDGPNVQMVYKDEVNVSFSTTNLARGHGAVIEIPGKADALQQFMYSALTTAAFKGDVRTILKTISQIHHYSTLLRTELALIKSKHPITLSNSEGTLLIKTSLLLPSARAKFILTFKLSQQFFQGNGVTVDIERKYGELGIAEVRKAVEGRVGSGGVECMRGACEELWEVWE